MTHKQETENFVGQPDESRPDEELDYSDEEPYCYRCDGTGLIITCIDDMCRGAGECMHGDGETLCPECGGRNAI